MMRGGRNPAEPKWFYRAALWTIPFPLIANSFGWIFTEMGRQPWVVFSQMFTRDGVSPLVGPGYVLTSLIVLSAAVPGARGRRGRAARALRQGRAARHRAEAKAPLEPADATPDAATTGRPSRHDDRRRPPFAYWRSAV